MLHSFAICSYHVVIYRGYLLVLRIVVVFYPYHQPTTVIHRVLALTYNDGRKERNIIHYHSWKRNDEPCHRAHQEKRDTAALYALPPDD